MNQLPKCINCNIHQILTIHKEHNLCIYCINYVKQRKPDVKKEDIRCKECNCIIRNEYTRHRYNCTYIN